MASDRCAEVVRATQETAIRLRLNLDGSGQWEVHTGVPFLDHMLSHVAVHGLFDLAVTCQGDTEVDDHHSVEDIGIALGQAFSQALGSKAGIARYGSLFMPMDEALVLVAVDLSGRSLLVYDGVLPAPKVGTFDTELVPEFLRALAHKILSLYFNGSIVRRADQAARQIARYRCRGAVHFSHWGCRQSAGALHVLRAHLRKIGVPLLVLDGDCIDPENLQLGPLRTRVDAFMEMLA